MTVPILSVYDAQGNEIPIPAIVGPKGDTGDTGAQGPQGQQGDPGNDGHTPVRGVDYWTSSDKTEIIEDVLNEIYQGADLGLQIAAQLNQPANPADNMIWIETETAMPVGKFMVSSQQPTVGIVNGFLWLREMYLPLAEITLPESHVSMSIAQVWQYENGVWVWKKGHVYKAADEEWKDTGVYWFKSGTGFNTAVFGAASTGDAEVSQDNASISIQRNGGYVSCQTIQSAGKFKYLILDASVSADSSSFGHNLDVGASSDYTGSSFISGASQTLYVGGRAETVIDISSASSDFYPKCCSFYATASIYNVWLV